jgi:hypothetical protein
MTMIGRDVYKIKHCIIYFEFRALLPEPVIVLQNVCVPLLSSVVAVNMSKSCFVIIFLISA